jgi:hypothetical protein
MCGYRNDGISVDLCCDTLLMQTKTFFRDTFKGFLCFCFGSNCTNLSGFNKILSASVYRSVEFCCYLDIERSLFPVS